MGEMIEYRIEGLDELIEKSEKLNGHLPAILRTLLEKATFKIEGIAKDIVPHDAGLLRASINPKIDPSPIPMWGKVGPSLKYGLFVELGTKPHWPPIGPLKGWARRHGVSPYALQAAIAKRGTRAQPFMRPALEKSKEDIDKYVTEAGAAIQREWYS